MSVAELDVTQKKGPAAGTNGVGANSTNLRKHHSWPHARSQANCLATRFADEVDRAERGLLSCGFYDPIALNNAAYDRQIVDRDFTDPNHQALFRALIAHAELSFEPTIESVRHVTERDGAVWHYVSCLVEHAIRCVVFVEGSAALVDWYADQIVEARWRVGRIGELVADAERLKADDLAVSHRPDAPQRGIVVHRIDRHGRRRFVA